MKTFDPIVKNNSPQMGVNREMPNFEQADPEREDSPILNQIRTSVQRMDDAKNQPVIKKLLADIWMTNELHILFADTGLGKSILATAISDKLSKGEDFLFFKNDNEAQQVLYYDFELSDRQFRKRYTDDMGNDYQFSEKLFVDNIDFAELIRENLSTPICDLLFQKISEDIIYANAQVLVIDNLTYLSSQSTQDTQIALEVMRQLNILKKQYNLSILVLAHTPKRCGSSPLGINDLAGSKHLSNFADSISAIGKSVKDGTLRYIKQIKPSRSSEMIYDTNNVIICRIVKNECILTFEFVDFDKEYNHLRTYDEAEKKEQKNELIEHARILHKQGKSLAEIALELLGTEKSKGTISKWLNKRRE